MRSSIAETARLRNTVEPDIVGLAGVPVAEFRGERGAYRDEIVARIEAFGDLADLLAERLAVAHVQRAGENVDLRACVVDVIFLGDPKARGLEQPGERVADDRPAAMAHVHRARRVGRDIFDVDPLVVADLRQAVGIAFAKDRLQLLAPRVGREADVEEAGTRDLDGGDPRQRFQLGRDRGRQSARVRARALRKHHCGIARQVAMRRVARRLDRHGAAVQLGRQHAFGLKFIEHPVEERGIAGVKAQVLTKVWKAAALAQPRRCVTPP